MTTGATSFFAGCCDLDALKSRYRQLARDHHPDRGGDLPTMQAINAEYEQAFRAVRKGQGIPHDTINDDFEAEAELLAQVRAVSHLDGVDIEICGRWVWVTGNTYPHKDTLKEAGYRWASKKRCWYWRPADAASRRSRRELALSDIRTLHGSHTVKRSAPRPLEAA